MYRAISIIEFREIQFHEIQFHEIQFREIQFRETQFREIQFREIEYDSFEYKYNIVFRYIEAEGLHSIRVVDTEILIGDLHRSNGR